MIDNDAEIDKAGIVQSPALVSVQTVNNVCNRASTHRNVHLFDTQSIRR